MPTLRGRGGTDAFCNVTPGEEETWICRGTTYAASARRPSASAYAMTVPLISWTWRGLRHRGGSMAAALGCLLVVFGPTNAANAQSAVFDKPLAADPAVGLQRCTYYPDLTVRETQTDSPATGPAYLLLGAVGSRRAACVAGGRKLDVAEQAFVGRKGGFLFFVPTDANGAEPFEVLSVKDGSKLYDDVMVPDAFKSASVSGEALHLVYTRGYDGSCSLLTGGAACWATMMKEGRFARAISQQAPPLAACHTSYDAPGANEKPSYPSEITYDVDVTIEAGKKAVVNSRGQLGCRPAG